MTALWLGLFLVACAVLTLAILDLDDDDSDWGDW